jgi:chitodextrinase
MHFWATQNSRGLNFHTGATSVYDPIMPTTLSATYTAEPVAYGIKAFGLGSSGENVSTVIGSNPNNVNITAYGVLDSSTGNLFVTIINKEHFAGAKNATVTLAPGAPYTAGKVWILQQATGDVTATSGVTLGVASIGGDGNWNGTASPISPSSSGNFTINVSAASAAIVELTGKSAPPPPPQPPSNLAASAVSNNQINLSWTASPTSGVTYNVFRSTTSGFVPSSSNRIASAVTGTSFSDTGLACGTAYFYLVEAANAGGTSSPTNQASATTQNCVAMVVKINSGGPALAPFVADVDFTGGSTINHANTIDLSAVTNPAPMAVYQTARVANFTYTIPGFSPGSSHTIRLHFAETFFSTAGSRTFNVSINGTQVLTNFDVFAAAGAKNKAVIEQFTVNANASGQYVVQFTSVVNQSLLSGLEVQ